MTEFLPFDPTSIEESVMRFLDRVKDYGTPTEEPIETVPRWVLVATAALALEATRRWHHREAAVEWNDPNTQRGPALHGLS